MCVTRLNSNSVHSEELRASLQNFTADLLEGLVTRDHARAAEAAAESPRRRAEEAARRAAQRTER